VEVIGILGNKVVPFCGIIRNIKTLYTDTELVQYAKNRVDVHDYVVIKRVVNKRGPQTLLYGI
jgi:hypothetical protein